MVLGLTAARNTWRKLSLAGDALVIGIGGGRRAGGGLANHITRWYALADCYSYGFLLAKLCCCRRCDTLTRSGDVECVTTPHSAWFDIHAPREIAFNLDGEPLSGTRVFHITVLRGIYLRCHATPPDCPLLRWPG